MARPPALVAADGTTPLARMLTSDIATASMNAARSIQTNHPERGLTPERLAQILLAAEEGDATAYLELAEAMEEKYLHCLSVLGTRKRQVAQLDLSVEAASDAPVDQAKAQTIRDFLKRDTLEAELFDILDAINKGFSLTEIIWDLRHQPWLPARLEWRDPRWFEMDRTDGRTPLLKGNGAPQPLPPFKFIYHVHSAKSGLPLRGGLARPIAWAYMFQNFALKDWVSFAEIFGRGLRIGKYGPGADDNQIRTLMQAVRNISSDAAAVIPDSMQMEIIASQSTGSADLWERLCAYLDKQVSKAVLGQTATTDSEGGGLGGSGKEHNDVRGDIERADAKLLAATLNRDLVRPIIDFNFGRSGDGGAPKYPQINIGRADPVDTEQLMKGVETFVAMGGRVAMSVVRDKLGLPDPQAGEELLTAPARNAPAGAPGAPGGPVVPENGLPAFLGPLKPSYGAIAGATGLGNPAQQPQDDIDQLVQVLVDEGWEAALGPMVSPLIAELAAAASYDDALARLVPALAKMDSAALAERLERAAFAVRAAAAVGADGQLTTGG